MALFTIITNSRMGWIEDMEAATFGEALRKLHEEGSTFEHANLAQLDLDGADLSGMCFRYADFKRTSLRGVNFQHADLVGATLTGADLTDANLYGARLVYADCCEATLNPAALASLGFPLPCIPDLDGLILRSLTKGQTLDMSTWHTCETTHCRAGFAVVAAGLAGTLLEERLGASMAGALIYANSVGYIPDFYASTQEALDDMRAHAYTAV